MISKHINLRVRVIIEASPNSKLGFLAFEKSYSDHSRRYFIRLALVQMGNAPKRGKVVKETSALDTAIGLPKKQESWAVVAMQNKGNVYSKPLLTQSLTRN